jgi:hypothetical protein
MSLSSHDHVMKLDNGEWIATKKYQPLWLYSPIQYFVARSAGVQADSNGLFYTHFREN